MEDPRSPSPGSTCRALDPASVRAERAKLVAGAVRSGQRRDDAEDGVHDAFLTLWTRMARGDAPPEVGPWLQRCARNLCRLRHRDDSRRRAVHALAAFVDTRVDDGLDPTVLDAHRQCAALPRLLGALSPRSRDVLLAHVADGESFPMIARRFGMTLITTRRTVQRALATLRAEGVALALWKLSDFPEALRDC